MPNPSDYPIHPQRGVRFYVSPYNTTWHVCGGNGTLLATCYREDVAEMLAKAANSSADAEVVRRILRVGEAARLQRLREIGRADDAREGLAAAVASTGNAWAEQLDAATKASDATPAPALDATD